VKTQFQLITIDVWDTLLRRRCHPDAVKIYVSNFLLNNYFTDIKPEYRDSSRLTIERQSAEARIGQHYRSLGMDDEYGLLEVYRHWLQVVCCTSEHLESIVHTLERVEMEQEKHVIYADPDIEKFLESYTSSTRVFVSDFYMGSEKLLALMKHVDLGHLVDRGYASCDYYLNKRSGRIFQFVLEREDVDAASVLHIGDNLHSDVRVPQKLGIESIAYLPKTESASRAALGKAFEERQKSIIEVAQQQKIAQMQGCTEAGYARELYEYGLYCAPLIVGFVLFVMEQSIRQRHQKIYFFTREGEFFKTVYDVLLKRQPLGQLAPTSEILEVSRLATFGPSLREFTPVELKRIWNLYSTQSFAALLKSINVDLGAANEHLMRHGIDPEESIRYPWMDQRVLDVFNDPAFIGWLSNEVGVNKRSLLRYLEQKGLSASSRLMAIVDIGWRGTIQDNLAFLFPNCQFDGYYLGLDKFLNEQPENARKTAFGPDLNKTESGQLSELLRAVAPLEMLCNSSGGSVIGYNVTGGCAVAERVVDSAEDAVIDRYVSHFQRGVVDFAIGFSETIRTHAISAEELRPMAVEIWRSIISKPSPAVVMAYFQLNHNEQFGVGGFKDKSSRIAISHWCRALTSPKGLRDLAIQLEETGWPEGYLARRNLLFVWSAIGRLRNFKRRIVEMRR
jgi:FMN phosphatase YigB (HAD superfamily)